jgi:tetratricopeptide (TPR) repeat protein
MNNITIYQTNDEKNTIKSIEFNEEKFKKYYNEENIYYENEIIYIKTFNNEITTINKLENINQKESDIINMIMSYIEFFEHDENLNYYENYTNVFFMIANSYLTDYEDYENSSKLFIETIKILDNKNINNDIKNTSLYNLSCIYSLKNNIELSLEYLEKSLLNNFNNVESIKNDEDLVNLRKSNKFCDLLKKYNLEI